MNVTVESKPTPHAGRRRYVVRDAGRIIGFADSPKDGRGWRAVSADGLHSATYLRTRAEAVRRVGEWA